MFVAEYGVTTKAQIDAAYQEGKPVICFYDGALFYLVYSTNRTACFVSPDHAVCSELTVGSNNTWASAYQEYVPASHASTHAPGGSDPLTGYASTAYVDEAVAHAGGGATVYEATIGTSWTEDSDTGVKTQTVAISGVTAANTAKVDHRYTGDGTSEGYAAFVEAENQYLTFITNGYAETVAGGIKFTIFGDANTVSIPIVVEVV